jgi:hypothetical protein
MRLMDHRKTWRFRLHGSSEQCVTAFERAFSKESGGLLARAKWDVRPSGNGAVAEYQGRSGVIGVATMLSSTASAEQESAIGSEVAFEIEGITADGNVTCAMWLSSGSTTIGFTSDGRFFRPYMRAVEDQLRRIDPAVQVAKS